MNTNPKGENPLISVIIPAYNHENFIKETLDAVLCQVYQPVELIILNDGSTDRTHDVIVEQMEKLEESLYSVVYINKQNEGVIKTLNKGIKAAKGEFLFFNASDDFMKPECLKLQVPVLKQNPEYGLAVCDNGIINDNSEICYWDQRRKNVKNLESEGYKTFGAFLQKNRPDVDFFSKDFGSYKSLLLGNYIPNGYLVRKTCIDEIGGYNEKAKLEDWNLMLNLSKMCKFKYIDKIMFFYRWHANNTIKQHEKMRYTREAVLSLEKDYAIQNGYEIYWKRGIRYTEASKYFFIFTLTKEYLKQKKRFILRVFGVRVLSFSIKKS